MSYMSKSTTVSLPLNADGIDENISIFGLHDRNLQLLEDQLDVRITAGKDGMKITGKDADIQLAEKVLRFLQLNEQMLPENQIKYYIRQLKKNEDFDLSRIQNQTLQVNRQGKLIRAKGAGQADYLETVRKRSVVFGVGPAGTGKSYLAVAWAINRLINEEISRIVLVRPVVEAGESLGFLPGDLTQKIDPYLRPLYDAMFDLLGYDAAKDLIDSGRIEIAPLAYMRGRTLNHSIIILDEAQNTTASQMKMFLTRIGEDSQAIITGDITQIDLPKTAKSGLKHAMQILENVEGIGFVRFTGDDVVRHRLVQKIIEAYDQHDDK